MSILVLVLSIMSRQSLFAQQKEVANEKTRQELLSLSKQKWQWMSDKHADIKETSIRFEGNTAIILDRIRLTAVVGGNEVVNPFMVTKVYVFVEGKWKLGSMSFTRLLGE